MMHKYFAGAVQPIEPLLEADADLAAAFARARRELDVQIASLAFHRGLEAIWRALDAANKYIVATAPFTLAKDPAQQPRVGAILHNCLEALRCAAQLVAPFLPDTAERLRTQLGLDESRFANLDLTWGAAFAPGHQVGEAVNLFPRIESAPAAGAAAPKQGKGKPAKGAR